MLAMKRPRNLIPLLLALLAAALLAGCGEKEEVIGDTTAKYGPGVSDTGPPWPAEYDHLKQRIDDLKLPPVGNEKYHRHAVIHIYNDDILIPVPANVGWLPQANPKVLSSIHTHEPNGVIHMESIKPHPFKLGDFFYIWGVAFGKNSIGGLRAKGDKRVWVYVNGELVPDAVNHVIREGDNIAIGYGAQNSFDHEPDASALKTVDGKGHDDVTCGTGGQDGKPESCVDQSAEDQSSEDQSSEDPGAED
jgi:hypothetical protein